MDQFHDLACLLEKYLKGTLGRGEPIPSLMMSEEGNLGYGMGFKLKFQDEPVVLLKPAGSSQGIQTITVTFGLDVSAVGVAPPLFFKWLHVLADLEWGQGGGGNFKATIDVFHGTTLTLTAADLRVLLRSPTGPIVGADSPTPYDDITVTCALTWGTRGGRSPVTRTFDVEILAPAASSALRPIPNFSYSMDLYATGAASDFTVTFWSAAPAAQAVAIAVIPGVQFDAGRVGDGVHIPPTANFWSVTNVAAVARDFTASFRLSM